jgi:hypothetical protein
MKYFPLFLLSFVLISCLGKKGSGGEISTSSSGSQNFPTSFNNSAGNLGDIANEINQTNSPTPTPSPTPTSTPSAEVTVSATPIPEVSSTPLPTPTPTPTTTSSYGSGNINTAIEILNEELNGFTYSPSLLGVFDYATSSAVALNFLESNNLQSTLIYSQVKLPTNWSPIRLNKISLPAGQISNHQLEINDRFHLLKKTFDSDQDFFLISAYPPKIYNINLPHNNSQPIGEIAINSTIAPSKRIIGFIHQNRNKLCGTLSLSQKYFFYKDEENNLHEYIYDESEKPKLIYCLKDQSVLIQTASDNLISLNLNGQNLLGGKTTNSCTKISLTLRGEELYYLCYYYNSANKLVYKTYHIAPDGLSLSLASLPTATPAKTIPYTTKIDNYSSGDFASPTIFYFKKASETSWAELHLETISFPKTIISMKVHEGELILHTQFALIRFKQEILAKYPLMLTPKEVFVWGTNYLVVSSNNQVLKIDGTKNTNIYQNSLLNNVTVENLNPSPFIDAGLKLTNLKNSISSEDIYRGYKDANGNYWILNNQLNAPENAATLAMNKNIIIDLKSNEEYLFVLSKDLSGKYWLSRYSKTMQFIHSQQINSLSPASGKITLSNNYLIISTLKDLLIFDETNTLIKKLVTTGFSSRSFATINQQYIIGVLNSKVIKIKLSTGEISELHSLAGFISASPQDVLLDNKTLYLNMGQTKILKMELPSSAIY